MHNMYGTHEAFPNRRRNMNGNDVSAKVAIIPPITPSAGGHHCEMAVSPMTKVVKA